MIRVKEAIVVEGRYDKAALASVFDAVIVDTAGFGIFSDREKLALLRGASHFTKIHAPMAIVVCGNLSRALPMQLADYWIQDCSAATENILLRAVDLGLGTVWCGIHPQKRAEKKVADALELPARHIPLNITWVGHPAAEPEPKEWYEEKHIHYIK